MNKKYLYSTPAALFAVAAAFIYRPSDNLDVEQARQSVVRVKLDDGAGSGFLVDKKGYIMTCAHVASDPRANVIVEFSDGSKAPAKVVGAITELDVALLKVDEKYISGRKPLAFNDEEIKVNDAVTEIGNPFDIGLSVSTGRISATMRPIGASPKVASIQFTAPTNPGNSGGPVIAANGKVDGMAEAIIAMSNGFGGGAQNSGVSFAIPAPYLKLAYDYLKLVDAEAPVPPDESQRSAVHPFFRPPRHDLHHQ